MSHHIVVALPDGRTACADYRSVIVPVMRRVNAWLANGKTGPRPDLAYQLITEWLDNHQVQSAACCAYLIPGGPDCGHAGPTKGE